MSRPLRLTTVLLGAIVAASACSSAGVPNAAPTSAASVPVASPPAAPPGISASPPVAAPTLSAADVADSGLPSRVGSGKLATPTIKRLIQYFEDKVSRAYATGNGEALSHYLAGPMLTGNRATIALLENQQKRNVFKIHVLSVKPQLNQAHQVIAEMTGDMTLDYFFNPKTRKVLDRGLPGPSRVQFVIFLNQNPKTKTWYWTGEKSEADASDTTATAQ